MACKKEANLCLRYSSKDYYIKKCYLGLTKKPNTTLACIKKPKSSIVTAKSKKQLITIFATINKARSSNKTSFINKLKNK